jgi:uncharacterized protein YoxC
VDEAAFEDFAGRLKREIERAAGESSGLRGLIEEVRQAGESLEAFAQQQQSQSERAGSIREDIEQQRAMVEALLERADELSTAHASFERGVDESLALRQVEIAQRVDAAMETFRGTLATESQTALRAVDDRVADIDTARAQMDQLASERFVEYEASLAEANERALGRVNEMIDRGEQTVALVESKIEGLLAGFEHTLDTRLKEVVADAEAKVEHCVGNAREQLADIETAEATLRQQVDEVVERALGTLRTECERAEGLIGGDTQTGSLRAQLHDAKELVGRLEGLVATSRMSEERLSSSFTGINAQVDEASRRYVALEESLRKSIRVSTSTETLLRSRTDDVRRLGEAMDAARARADQSIQTLQRNALHAETALSAGKTRQDQLGGMVENAQRLLESLEPWRGAMLEHSATHKLPEEIEQVVRKVRRSVLSEYMRGGKGPKPIGEQVELKHDPTVNQTPSES